MRERHSWVLNAEGKVTRISREEEAAQLPHVVFLITSCQAFVSITQSLGWVTWWNVGRRGLREGRAGVEANVREIDVKGSG